MGPLDYPTAPSGINPTTLLLLQYAMAQKQAQEQQKPGLDLGSLISGGGAGAGASQVAANSTPASAAPIVPSAPAGGLEAFASTAVPVTAAALGSYLVGKDVINTVKGKEDNSAQGLAGRVQSAITSGGLSELARPLFGSGDKWKTEGKRIKKLQEKGVMIPKAISDNLPTRGRDIAELVNKDYAPDYVGQDASQTGWVNNKFAKSRNEADLVGQDIVGYSAFAEKDPNWFNKPLQERIDLANKLLAAKAVREHRGTIDIDWSKYQPQAPAATPVQLTSQPSATPTIPKIPVAQNSWLRKAGNR